MADLNQVNLIGRLTKDVELKQIAIGQWVASFSLAVNRKWKQENEEKSDVTFLDIVAWGKTAENVSKYCKKGSLVFITGRLKQESWEDKTTGQKRYAIKVVAENIQFLDSATAKQTPQAEKDKPEEQYTQNETLPF